MTIEERKALNKRVDDCIYYIIIGVVSLISMLFLPMIGSTIGFKIDWPTTADGWFLWATTRGGVTIVNILLFYSFQQQGLKNVKNNPTYLEAFEKIKGTLRFKEYKPKSPKQHKTKAWLTKGIWLAVGTMLSTTMLTEAILKWDLIQFLTYVFTIAMGLVFGLLHMKSEEDYWTSEFPDWVKLHDKLVQEDKEKEVKKNGRQDSKHSRTSRKK